MVTVFRLRLEACATDISSISPLSEQAAFCVFVELSKEFIQKTKFNVSEILRVTYRIQRLI